MTPRSRLSERKVLILMPLAQQRGGAELALWHLLKERVDAIAWHVAFFEQGPLIQQVADLGIPVDAIPAGRLRQPWSLISTIRSIEALSRRIQAEGILSWMSKAHVYGGPAAYLARKPALWFQHSFPEPPSSMDRLTTLIRARGVLACSAGSAAAQARLRPRREVQVVHPGVELDRFCPERMPTTTECREALGLPASATIVGMVGRLQRWKGMHTLIEAMPAVASREPNTHFVIVGGGHQLEPGYEQELRDRADAAGVAGRLTFAGFQADVQKWMHSIDIFVHASDNEPFGMVILEAMAMGKPVIAGDRGGPTEIITPGRDGILTPFEDAPALSDAILRYIQDPALASEMGRRGRKRAQEFSTRHFACRISDVVLDMLGERQQHAALQG